MKIRHPFVLRALVCSTFLFSDAARGQFAQQGPKLVGTGAVGYNQQGDSVSLSADGNTVLVGGAHGTWVWTRRGTAWIQQAKLEASGGSVAVSGDGNTAIVGTGGAGAVIWTRAGELWTQGPRLDVGSDSSYVSLALSSDGNTAAVGRQLDNNSIGAAWVLAKNDGIWSQQSAMLVGSGAVGRSYQGTSVSLSADGNTLLVGGYNDNNEVGAAWAWTRSGGAWTQQGDKLVGSGAVGIGGQGVSVSVSADGNTAIVGGFADDTGTGAAWVWTRSGGVWTQQGDKLVGTGALGAAGQGRSVSLSADGNTAMVGGWNDSGRTGAAWVWTRTGAVWVQTSAKLVGVDAVGTAYQGYSVSLSADGTTGIFGGPGDHGLDGAAWVWAKSGGAWTQQGPKLVGTGVAGAASQGYSVAISGDGNTAIVGGPLDDSQMGAAWIWIRSAGVWTQQGEKLVGLDAVPSGCCGVQQGVSVALSADGNTAIVGGPSDINSEGSGAAWVWTRSGGVWTQQGNKLVGSGAVGGSSQGGSVALSADGNTAIVGGDADDGFVGAAWVWTRSGGVWTQQGKLIGSGAVGHSRQGFAVAISADGNTAIVGGYGDNLILPACAPDPSFLISIGASWIWTRSAGVWTQQGAKLVGSDLNTMCDYWSTRSTFNQGISVSLSADGRTAIVGGHNGFGAGWIWRKTGEQWNQEAKLTRSDLVQGQGGSVALSADGNTAVVGGSAASVWTRSEEVWSQLGARLVGSDAVGWFAGVPVSLSWDGRIIIFGGWLDNNRVGAAWIFAAPAPQTWPVALLPSSARMGGLGGAFYTTDLTVANTGTTPTTFVVKFLGNNVDGRLGPEKTFPILAGASTTFSDVLGSMFGLAADYGAIRITSPSDAVRVVGQTSTPGFGGTFGQSISASEPADLILAGTPRSILGIREDALFRTNLILTNATEGPLDVHVTLVAESGTVLGTPAKSFTLAPLGMIQVTRVVRELGVATNVSGARLVVSTPSAGKSFAAYASVIDNATNDPRTLLPVGPIASSKPSPDYWIVPSSARKTGAGSAFYTTDVTVAYTNAESARYTLKFLGHDVDGRGGPETTFDLGAQKSVTYPDVLGSVFQKVSDYGAIRVASQYPSSDSSFIGVLTQTSTPGFGGTFGQSVPAATSPTLIRTGVAQSILAVREDDSFRTNLILTNATEAALDVDVQLVSEGGDVLATKRYSLAPLGMTQVTRVVRDMGIAANLRGGRLVISTPTGDGAFAAYASSIDNVTNDPRTLLPR